MKRIWNKYNEIEKKIKQLNFKLYKYYSIDKGMKSYSIQNLLNSVIYFSAPSIFNDPFDSNIGADFSESFYGHKHTMVKDKAQSLLIKNIITTCLSSNLQNTFVNFWKDFASYIKFDNNANIYYFDLLRYLYYLKNNNQILNLYNFFQIRTNNEYELADCLISQASSKKYLQTVIVQTKNIELTVKDYKDSLSSMYRLFGKNTDFIECDKINNNLLKIRKKMSEVIKTAFRVSCFSESPLNVLMWSHYGDKHKGFCVEYDFDNYFATNGYDNLFCPVVYTTKRISVKLNKHNTKYKGYDINYARALDSLFTKSSIWSYEKEWRKVIVNNAADDLYEKVKITKVYLGSCISKKDEKMIRRICKEREIEVIKVGIDDSFYKLIESK